MGRRDLKALKVQLVSPGRMVRLEFRVSKAVSGQTVPLVPTVRMSVCVCVWSRHTRSGTPGQPGPAGSPGSPGDRGDKASARPGVSPFDSFILGRATMVLSALPARKEPLAALATSVLRLVDPVPPYFSFGTQ